MALGLLKRGKIHYIKGYYTNRTDALNKGINLVKNKKIKHFIIKLFRGRYELWVAR